MSPFELNRRRFLGSSAALAGAVDLSAWFGAEAKSLPRPRVPLSPNDRPSVALIGCGGMGRHDARLASGFGEVVALCDVDESRLGEAHKQHPGAKRYRDFRDCLEHPGLHAIINGTPSSTWPPSASARTSVRRSR
jgi:hypothetical protein